MEQRPANGRTPGDELRSALAHGPVAFDFAMALIESMPVVPYIDAIDERTTVYVAPQVRDVLGIEADAYISAEVDPWFDHLHPDDREATIAELEVILAAGGGKQEYRFVRPDTGEVVWIEDRLTVIEVDGRRLSPGVLMDVTRQKTDADLIAEQMRTLERIDAVSQQLTDLVVHTGDVTAIVDLLADLVGGAVLLTDATGESLARVGAIPAADVAPAMRQEVRLRGEGWGTLAVFLDRPVERADEIAVARATTNLALALLLEREASLITETALSSLVNDVVMERITSGRELRRRARALGVDFGRSPLRVIIVEPVAPWSSRGKARDRGRDRLVPQLNRRLSACGCTALVAFEGDRVVGVASVPVDLEKSDMEAKLTQPGMRTGVSELVDGDDLLRAYHHAVDAVEHAALRLPGGGGGAVVHFEDLGLSHLLSRLAEGPELARFVENELRPLVQHDRTHGGNLMHTLTAYLAENGSKTAAAKRLGVERRTVYYRLERIADLLGRDLDDPESRLRLDVALRGWEVVQGNHDQRPG